jgi:hypothetical protein
LLVGLAVELRVAVEGGLIDLADRGWASAVERGVLGRLRSERVIGLQDPLDGPGVEPLVLLGASGRGEEGVSAVAIREAQERPGPDRARVLCGA